MKIIMNTAAFSLLATLLLSGCMLGGGEMRYRLIAPQVEVPRPMNHRAVDRTLAIARPETDRTRDSSRILVRRDRTLLPWTGVAWIDRTPDLLQDLAITYLDGRVATTGRYGSLPATYRLDLVIRRFEFAEEPGGLQAELSLVARLFDASGELRAVTTLIRREPGGQASIDEVVPAMERVMLAVFDELADWLHGHLEPEAVD